MDYSILNANDICIVMKKNRERAHEKWGWLAYSLWYYMCIHQAMVCGLQHIQYKWYMYVCIYALTTHRSIQSYIFTRISSWRDVGDLVHCSSIETVWSNICRFCSFRDIKSYIGRTFKRDEYGEISLCVEIYEEINPVCVHICSCILFLSTYSYAYINRFFSLHFWPFFFFSRPSPFLMYMHLSFSITQ